MTSLKDLQDNLRQFSCHFTWDLEYKSIKQFQSLMSLINEHIAESPAMVIEGLLFKSYLLFSDFKGSVEKQKSAAVECLNEVRTILQNDPREASLKNGYLQVTLALEAWLDRRDKTKLEAKVSGLKELESKYEAGSPDQNMFLGSIHATKGFAFSRLGMTRYSESIEQFQKAVEMCPHEKDWWFSLGLINWRKGKASVRRNELCNDMKEAESIFYNVLKMDRNHSYAMVLIADIKRRKRNTKKAEEFLKSALRPKPTREKIIGEVAQVYRRMQNYDEALNVLRNADSKPNSFIHHQLYLIYRDKKTPSPVDYLQKAIDANPCNLAARFDQAKEYITQKRYSEARERFDYILDNFGSDPEAMIQTNFEYAKFLVQINERDSATDKYQTLLDEALITCKENDDPPFSFFKEIDWIVRIAISELRLYFEDQLKENRNVKETRLKLADLEKKLGNHSKACRHYEQIIQMQPAIDTGLKWTILQYLCEVKTRKALFTDVDCIVQNMEQISLQDPKPTILHKCKADLAAEKGKYAFQSGKGNDAINLFIEAVKFGSLAGARLLLDEVKKMDRGNRDFYTRCAQIIVCIEQSDSNEKEKLKKDVDTLLSADTSEIGTILGDLRKTQVNLEKCCIMQDETQIAVFRVDIIHKCRTILNQTMAKFRDRHYAHVDISCDFFNIPNISFAKVAQEVRKKLQKKYGWSQFEHQFPDLFQFIVSIQPASNPYDNNWMFALLRMDNANKHESPLGEKLKVEVYSDNAGNMAEQEFTTIEVAREACDNIRKILNEFYKYL